MSVTLSPHSNMATTSGELVDIMEEGLGTTGDPIVDEAKREFRRCSEWEAHCRQLFIEDLKFSYGDADNGYQWPSAVRRSRDVDSKPCLTMNIIRQHNLQIINDAKRNKGEVTVLPTGGGASFESAQVYRDLLADIQYSSQAQLAYAHAREFQVYGGIGWWRIVTRCVDNTTFDQEIRIEPVVDALSVYMDPDIKMQTGSDARFALVFDDVPRSEFRRAYPEFEGIVGRNPLGVVGGDDDWITRSHIRLCEYFRKATKGDWLLSFMDPADGMRKTIKESDLPANLRATVKADPMTKRRRIWEEVIEWYLIAGDQIIDQTIWPGKYIPLIRVIGEEHVVDGILDRKGHTRAMKDGQRMYNYNASAQVEVVALQTKTPWTGSAASIDELQQYWNNANSNNAAFLPFNHIDDDGNPIPAEALPRRLDPPTPSAAFETGMQTAFSQVMMVSGQWQNTMGMAGNERTGEAIQGRQEQGDTATYHFRDNYESALIFTGMQIVDLVPKIMDTNRIMMIQAEDSSMFELQVDPTAAQALQVKMDTQGKVVRKIFNPNVGRYEVRAAPGQAFGTRRQETVQALTLLLTQAPALTGIVGDLLLQAMDFKEAQEAAQRLKRMVPPQALGQGPTPNEQKLMEHNLALTNALKESLQHLAKEQLKLQGKTQKRDIDVYDAETKRFAALADALMLDQGGLKQVIDDLVKDAATTHLGPILEANKDELDDDTEEKAAESAVPPPMPGAKKAPDGEWYLQDPTRAGKYLRVAPLAQERSPGNIVGNA